MTPIKRKLLRNWRTHRWQMKLENPDVPPVSLKSFARKREEAHGAEEQWLVAKWKERRKGQKNHEVQK